VQLYPEIGLLVRIRDFYGTFYGALGHTPHERSSTDTTHHVTLAPFIYSAHILRVRRYTQYLVKYLVNILNKFGGGLPTLSYRRVPGQLGEC
jgi:hypothetical protein